MKKFFFISMLLCLTFLAQAQRFSSFSKDPSKTVEEMKEFYSSTPKDRQREAKEILDGANSRVSQDIDALEEEKNALQQEVDMLKAAARDYRERFQRLIDDQQHILKAETGLFE